MQNSKIFHFVSAGGFSISNIASGLFIFSALIFAEPAMAQFWFSEPAPPAPAKPPKTPLKNICLKELSKLPGKSDKKALEKVCSEVKQLSKCQSKNNIPIYHYDRMGTDPAKGKRIYAMALIHGDELASGAVARSWMERLSGINPRNSWRVMPIANPDGLKLRTRMNAAGVDLNRNFPTEDWNEEAVKRWTKSMKKDPRRFPGSAPGSEPETQCYVQHFEDFQPDFIISIHTPLAVLDFDGPKMRFPQFRPLPWISLGNFPGSLGRYMWKDRGVPVLTIELKPGSGGVERLEQFDRLQDITGTVAIQVDSLLDKNEKNKRKRASSEVSQK